MSRRSLGPEARAAMVIAAIALIFIAPIGISGRTPYWGDLTYLHNAWHTTATQYIQAGRLPLWDPALYLGVPMAATMQGGLFSPPTILFYCFGFVDAMALFHFWHFFLAGFLAALWLKSLKLSWGASLGGAISLAFGGFMISRIQFLNHMAVLSWVPALALFFHRPQALAMVLALMFFGGYPTFIPGAVLVIFGLAFALKPCGAPRAMSWIRTWFVASVCALVLSSAQFLPALELMVHSRRSSGVEPSEAMTWGFSLRDLSQWISPLLVPWALFKPEIEWWKCVYLGIVASCAAGWGLWQLPRRRSVALSGLLLAILVLTLGSSNRLSEYIWRHFWLLHFIRYPGNLAYMAILPLTVLVGAGLGRSIHSKQAVLLMAFELLSFAWMSTPTAPRALFVTPGPLVQKLQAKLAGMRYLISPRALETMRGADVVDWKSRLYGLTNSPYRIAAVANIGEPLVPADNYAVMDRLLSARSVEHAAALMPWVGASRLLTPLRPPTSQLLTWEEHVLWSISRLTAPAARVYQFSPNDGVNIPEGIPDLLPPLGRPLTLDKDRPDRFSVSGQGVGWIYVAEPRYPGWTTTLETSVGTRVVEPLPALRAFQKVHVPNGPWTVRWDYDPDSWRIGVWLSVAALLMAACYWYHRLSRMKYVTH